MIYPPNGFNTLHMIIHRRHRRAIRNRQRRSKSNNVNLPHTFKSRKSHKLRYQNDNGEWVVLKPHQTYWAIHYINTPDLLNPSFHAKFRKRFRLPHQSFLGLLSIVRESNYFERWRRKYSVTDVRISLLLLGVLRYLGRGWCLDDLEEATCISREVHRIFFTNLCYLEKISFTLNM